MCVLTVVSVEKGSKVNVLVHDRLYDFPRSIFSELTIFELHTECTHRLQMC